MDSWSIATTNQDELIHQANVHIQGHPSIPDRGWISTAWAAAKVLLFQRFFSTLPSYSVHSLTQAAALDVLPVHCTSCAFSNRSSYDINCSIEIPKTIKTRILSVFWIPICYMNYRIFLNVYHTSIAHDGSMVLLYMVCHGSHQYTPFMLAYIPCHTWILWVVGFYFTHQTSSNILVLRHPGAWWSWMHWTAQKSCEGSQGMGLWGLWLIYHDISFFWAYMGYIHGFPS